MKFDLKQIFQDKHEIQISEDKIYPINASIKTYLEYQKALHEFNEEVIQNKKPADDLEVLSLVIKYGLGENVCSVIKAMDTSIVMLQEICYAIMSAWTGRPVESFRKTVERAISGVTTEKK